MLFNSLQFYIFFPVVIAVYFLLPQRFRASWLLLASCYFYISFIPIYLLVLGATILLNFISAIFIARSQGSARTALLFLCVALNVLFLAFFKYYGFIDANLDALARFIGWNYGLPLLQIALPLGLSFHTFQALSYIIEVYRRRFAVEHNLGIFALYVMFFPQLVAGPIERPQHLLHQFYEYHPFSHERVVSGLQLMARGFFKKIVIADNAALLVNAVFSSPELYHGAPLILATVFFSIQLFCDFSGYSDIARGAARVMGFELMLNFNRPYVAESLADYWRRWHISLSTWFRDYVFQPLVYGRKKLSPWWLYCSLIITFSISGLWHGANWTFVIWGFAHGFLMALSLVTKNIRARAVKYSGLLIYPKVLRSLRMALTTATVALLLVLFRAETIEDALYIFSGLGHGLISQLTNLSQLRADSPGVYFGGLAIVIVSILFYIAFSRIMQWLVMHRAPERLLAVGLWYSFLLWILYFGSFGRQSFIYFQF